VKVLFALGRTIRVARGVKICWVIASKDVTVGIVCTFGGVESKG